MPRKAQVPHLRIRIEPRLLARLEKSRGKNGRTLTGEIVERLEESFRREDRRAEWEAIAKTAATTALQAERAGALAAQMDAEKDLEEGEK